MDSETTDEEGEATVTEEEYKKNRVALLRKLLCVVKEKDMMNVLAEESSKFVHTDGFIYGKTFSSRKLNDS